MTGPGGWAGTLSTLLLPPSSSAFSSLPSPALFILPQWIFSPAVKWRTEERNKTLNRKKTVDLCSESRGRFKPSVNERTSVYTSPHVSPFSCGQPRAILNLSVMKSIDALN
ncbi:hypothetical protein INR49_021626 [Caranx melampygus]|nr:hypothetical protein INR49_021626 [Caranx melampygus]